MDVAPSKIISGGQTGADRAALDWAIVHGIPHGGWCPKGRNNYKKEVFNGDIGQMVKIDSVEREVVVQFDQREVVYDYGELDEVALAYAITVHKSQGSEFPVVVIPLATQHYLLLQRNLVYTGITRGKKLVVLIGQRKAMGMAVKNNRTERRFSGLLARLNSNLLN